MYKTEAEHLLIAGLGIDLYRITNTDELYERLVAKGQHHEDVKEIGRAHV